jgi:hypothetical protein
MSSVHQLPDDKWLPVSIAPSDIDLEVGVMGKREMITLVFPVRKQQFNWVDAQRKKPVDIGPTHWRPWRFDR